MWNNPKTATRTFDLRNVAQKRSRLQPFRCGLCRLFTVPFFFRKIVKIERLKFKVTSHGTIRNNDS